MGWLVYWGDTVVARLEDPRSEDMFWTSWAVVRLRTDLPIGVTEERFWRAEAVHLRRPDSDQKYTYVGPALAGGRVTFRGPYPTEERLTAKVRVPPIR